MPADILPRCVIVFAKPQLGLGIPIINDVSKAVKSVAIRQTSTRQDKATINISDNEMQFLGLFSPDRSEEQTVSIWLGWADYVTEVFSGWVPMAPTTSYAANGLVTTTVTLSSMAMQVFKHKTARPKSSITDDGDVPHAYEESVNPEKMIQSRNPHLAKIKPVTFGFDATEFIGGYFLDMLLIEIAAKLDVDLVVSWSKAWKIPVREEQKSETLREFVHRMGQKYQFRYRFVQQLGRKTQLIVSPLGKADTGEVVDYNLHYFKGEGTKRLRIPYYGTAESLVTAGLPRETACTAVTNFSIRDGSGRSSGMKIAKDKNGEIIIYKDGFWYSLNKQAFDVAQAAGKLPSLTGEFGIYRAMGTTKAFKMIEPYLIREKIAPEGAKMLLGASKPLTMSDLISFEASCTAEMLGDPTYQPGMFNTLEGIHGIWCNSTWQCENVQHQFTRGTYTTQANIRATEPVLFGGSVPPPPLEFQIQGVPYAFV